MEGSERAKWDAASNLLEQLLALPEGERTAAAGRLGADAGVGAELSALLEGARRPSILDEPLDVLFDILEAGSYQPHALRGRSFGGWVLDEEIGRGGMAVVYRARRRGEGYEQQAAFKLLSIAFLDPRHLESFRRERRILSELTHPGIARLIDGGVTPEGAPFLVMEYIDGQRIDDWWRDHPGDNRTVVRLVEQVCRAAAHAHRHLIVHRDINPSNVLVDPHGRPVLVDFGIAKLLGDAETGRTLQAFTPAYAAPEQEAGGAITTATDVFGLGMLLSLLVAEDHRDRDLRSIVQVATHEDPGHRYVTAEAMADDLVAWLERRPVLARPDSLLYRARKFAARNGRLLGLLNRHLLSIKPHT